MKDISREDSHFFRVEAAGGVVMLSDGRVLMMMRRGRWDLPKGHLEKGETLRECAAREVCEECGLVQDFLEVGEELIRTVHRYYYEPTAHHEEKYTTWFAMRYNGSEEDVTPQTEEEITELRWVSPNEARRLAATTYATIQEVIGKL